MVFVQDDKEELTVDAVNQFSLQNAISKKDLEGLHARIKELEADKVEMHEQSLKSEKVFNEQISKLRDEIDDLEKAK